MRKGMLVLTVVLISLLATAVFGEWTLTYFTDEMTGQRTWYASSPISYPNSVMNFPYADACAWLIVLYNGENDLPLVLFNLIPTFLNTSIGDGYYLLSTRVKWNNSVEQMEFYQPILGNGLFFIDYKRATKMIRASKTMRIELNWLGNGLVYFDFDLTGASKAIDNLHAVYGKK